jgi:hypothetical protein
MSTEFERLKKEALRSVDAAPVESATPKTTPQQASTHKSVSSQKIVIIGVLILGLICGYFLGREHIKYEMRSAMEQALAGFGKGMRGIWGGDKDSKSMPAGKVVEAQKSKEATEYIQNSMIAYDVSSRYQKDIVDGKVAAVFGKLKNNGNRTLKRVEVTAYFLDGAGNVIFENSFPAVFTGSMMSHDSPLKPNYIKEFGFKAKNCPTEWSEGKVKLAITDAEFE